MKHIKNIKNFILEKSSNLVSDDRKITWEELEKNIQERSSIKDPSFKLEGPWKKFLRNQDGYKVYIVDGEWLRTNLSVIFGHGAHGYAHEWCPNDEIWIDYRHNKGNCCKTDVSTHPYQRMSNSYIESTILHEITENKEMKSGKPYWTSHNISIDIERETGFLKDPYDDTQDKNFSISLNFKKD